MLKRKISCLGLHWKAINFLITNVGNNRSLYKADFQQTIVSRMQQQRLQVLCALFSQSNYKALPRRGQYIKDKTLWCELTKPIMGRKVNSKNINIVNLLSASAYDYTNHFKVNEFTVRTFFPLEIYLNKVPMLNCCLPGRSWEQSKYI